MSILVLFSSGGAQMAYHICEEDGMHLIFDNCNESAAQELSKGINSDCCKSTQVEYAITENCKCDEPQEAKLLKLHEELAQKYQLSPLFVKELFKSIINHSRLVQKS